MEGSEKKHISQSEFLLAYEEYADALFRFCYLKTSNREVALDILQTTFLKTWEYIAGGKQIGNLRAFLYQVARNQITDYYRAKREDSLDVLQAAGFDTPTPDESAEERIERDLEMTRIIRALETLDQQYREVLLLRFVEEYSLDQLADLYRESKNTLSVRIHRGIKKLQHILHHEE